MLLDLLMKGCISITSYINC